jgi:hypothetical protein
MINFMLMQKVIKIKGDLFKKECTLTHDPELDKLKGKVWAPKKLEEVNKMLRKLKTLPK